MDSEIHQNGNKAKKGKHSLEVLKNQIFGIKKDVWFCTFLVKGRVIPTIVVAADCSSALSELREAVSN